MKYDTNPNIIREIPHDYHPFNDPVKRLLDFFLNACFVGKCYCDSKCVFFLSPVSDVDDVAMNSIIQHEVSLCSVAF